MAYRITGNRAALALAALAGVAVDLALFKLWEVGEVTNHLGRAAAALAIIGVLLALRLSSPREHGLATGGSGDWRWIAALSVVVLAASAVLTTLALLFVRLTGLGPRYEDLHGLLDFLNEDELRRYLLVGLVLAPLTEELVYRAVALPGLAAVFGTRLAVFLSGPLFYALHVVYERQWFLFHYFVAGWLLSWAFVARGKLWVAIVLHALGNVLTGTSNAVVWLAPDFVRWLLGQS